MQPDMTRVVVQLHKTRSLIHIYTSCGFNVGVSYLNCHRPHV